MCRSSYGNCLRPNLLGPFRGGELGNVASLLSLADRLDFPACPQAIPELLLRCLGQADESLLEGAESAALVGRELGVVVVTRLLGPLSLADDSSLDQARGHAQVLERVDLLEGRGHGQLGGVTRVHARHKGVDHLLEDRLAKMAFDEVLDRLLVIRLRGMQANGSDASSDLLGDREEAEEWRVLGLGREREQLLVPVDTPWESVVSEHKLVLQAKVNSKAHDLTGGLEGVGSFLPEKPVLLPGDDVASNDVPSLSHKDIHALLEQREPKRGATHTAPDDERVVLLHASRSPSCHRLHPAHSSCTAGRPALKLH
mmetsp:Transcript_516/g.1160  ORF Transcript_516/g.1160 Transcript_516/m.1160 type:complete len:313 (+) Transcript_516:707-1645(+)